MGIEARGGSGDEVAGDILQLGLGCSCSHMSKKVDWMSAPSLAGSTVVSSLPSGPFSVTGAGNLPGLSFEKFSKNMTARSVACGFGVAGFSLTHLATRSGCVFAHAST